MGNGVKGLLVALFILSVVVVAKLVHKDSEADNPDKKSESPAASASGQKPLTSTHPTARSPAGPNAVRPGSSSTPATGARLAPGGTVVGTRPIERSGPASTNPGPASTLSPVLPPVSRAADAAGATNATAAASEPRPASIPAPATELSAPARPANPAAASSNPPPAGAAATAKSEGLVASATPSVPAAGDGFVPQPAPGVSANASPRTSTNIAALPTTRSSAIGFRGTESTLGEIPTTATTRGPAPRAAESGGPFDAPIGGAAAAAPRVAGTASRAGAAASAVALPAVHEVRTNDSYWRLAETYYGPGMGWLCKEIQKANNQVSLVPGKKIQIPVLPASALAAAVKPGAAPRPTATAGASTARDSEPGSAALRTPDGKFVIHVVQKGDTLTAIAKRYLRGSSGVSAIKDANSFLHYSGLEEGQKLKIPVAK